MAVVAGVCGVVLIGVVLWEGFETIILPRRVTPPVPPDTPVLPAYLASLVQAGHLHCPAGMSSCTRSGHYDRVAGLPPSGGRGWPKLISSM